MLTRQSGARQPTATVKQHSLAIRIKHDFLFRAAPTILLLAALPVLTATPCHAIDPTIRIIEPNDYTSLPGNIFGYNTNIPATSASLNTVLWDHPLMIDAVEALAPGNLRYPGGTQSQYYNWSTQLLDGTDLIDKPAGGSGILGNQAGFLALTSATDTEPIFVFNVMTAEVANQLTWFDQTSGVTRWEIGNEVPDVVITHGNHEDYRGRIESAQDYVDVIGAMSTAIRNTEGGEDIKLSIAAATPVYLQQFYFDQNNQIQVPQLNANAAQQAWNHDLGTATYNGQPLDYDAVTQHIYLQPMLQYQEQLLWTYEQRAEWLFSAGDAFPQWLADYQNAYYPGKPVWLTEVGIATWTGDTDDQEEAKRAWWSKLAETNLILSFLADRGPVEIINKHLLANSNDTMPLQVVRHLDTLGSVQLVDPLAGMLAPIGQALHGGAEIDELAIENVSTFEGKLRTQGQQFPDVRAISVTNDGNGAKYLFLINRAGLPYTVRMLPGVWSADLFTAPLDATELNEFQVSTFEVGDGELLTLPAFSYVQLGRLGDYNPGVHYAENFDAVVSGTSINSRANWAGPDTTNPNGDVAIRLTSISGPASAGGLGTVGYGKMSAGVEFNFQDDAVRTLTGSQPVTTANSDGSFEMKVRVTDIQYTGSAVAAANANHSFLVLLGEGLTFDAGEHVDASAAAAFAIEFYNNNGVTAIHVSDGVKTGFNPSNLGIALADSAWEFDAWYLLQLTNITLSDVNDIITATLKIVDLASGENLVDPVQISSSLGTNPFPGGAFDQINSIGFRNVRGNGIVTIDDMVLSNPEPASLALFAAAGLICACRPSRPHPFTLTPAQRDRRHAAPSVSGFPVRES